MKAVLSSVGALLISAAILLAGGGLMSTLIAVRAQLEGFPVAAIGFLTSAYFAGFIAGCFGTPYLVCLLYTSPSPRDRQKSRMPSSA